jgi:hypothetical protein
MEDVYSKLDKDSQDALGAVVAELKETDIDSPINPPKTVISPPALDGEGRATMVEASPLSKKGPKGSKPSQDPAGWEYLSAKGKNSSGQSGFIIPDYSTNWVRAHLLNDNLHGPGKAWNLVPATRHTNLQLMEAMVESPAKILVLEKKKVIWYKTEITSWHSGGPKEEPYAAKFGSSFKYFPSGIKMSFGPMEKKGKEWVRSKSGNVFSKTFSPDLPPNMDHYPVPLDLLTSVSIIQSYTNAAQPVCEAVFFLLDTKGIKTFDGLRRGMGSIFETNSMEGYKSFSKDRESWTKSWKARFMNVFSPGSEKVRYT